MNSRTHLGEIDLWTKFKSGDQNAFANLYSLLAAEVFNCAIKLCRDESLAEDVVQEAWIRLIGSDFDAARPDATVAGWLKRTAINILREIWRDQKRAPHSGGDFTKAFEAVESLSDASYLDREDRLQAFVDRVHNCLRQLSRPQQLLLKTSRNKELEGLAKLMETLLGWNSEQVRSMFDAIWPDGRVGEVYSAKERTSLPEAANSARDRARKQFLKCVRNSSAE